MISVTAVRSFSYFALSFRSVISFLINDNLVNIREKKIFFAYSRVSNRRGGRKKRGGWQILVRKTNREGAINEEVGKNLPS